RPAPWGDRLLGRRRRRPGKYLRRDPRRLPVRRPADGGSGHAAGRVPGAAVGVQGRVRFRSGDRLHGLAPDRPHRRAERGARMNLVALAAMTAYAAFFLHAESQAEVLGLVVLAAVAVPVLSRFGW